MQLQIYFSSKATCLKLLYKSITEMNEEILNWLWASDTLFFPFHSLLKITGLPKLKQFSDLSWIRLCLGLRWMFNFDTGWRSWEHLRWEARGANTLLCKGLSSIFQDIFVWQNPRLCSGTYYLNTFCFCNIKSQRCCLPRLTLLSTWPGLTTLRIENSRQKVLADIVKIRPSPQAHV